MTVTTRDALERPRQRCPQCEGRSLPQDQPEPSPPARVVKYVINEEPVHA
jgi:hypothetical protein